MEMFDRDFPGHYLRLIKRVRTSVIALVPPAQGIQATLLNSGISREATGLFELEPQSEMLFPCEATGVDATWEIRMPKPSNPFDYRQEVIQRLGRNISADRCFSFRNQFADAWYELHNPDQSDNRMTVQFETTRDDFPANIGYLKVQHVLLYFARANGKSFEIQGCQLLFSEAGGSASVGGFANTIDGVISTRRGNAGGGGSRSALISPQPATGSWRFPTRRICGIVSRTRRSRISCS